MSGEGVIAATDAVAEPDLADEVGEISEVPAGTIEAHFMRLLDGDPVCQGNVTRATVRSLASYAEAARVLVDSDVMAERRACALLMQTVRDRLAGIEMAHVTGVPICSGDSVALEVRRLDAAIEGLPPGLHREGQ